MTDSFSLRVVYRVRQFWVALRAQPDPADLVEAQSLLSPTQMELFRRMQPGEQMHSLGVLRRLRLLGERQPDLLIAALLHDAGKSRLPLSALERAWVVLVGAFAPGSLERWGKQPFQEGQRLPAWQRPLVTARQHAEWGAEMAEQAGVPALAVELIRRHQDKAALTSSLEDRLLHKLQAVDDQY